MGSAAKTREWIRTETTVVTANA